MIGSVRTRKVFDDIETSFSEGVFDGRYHPTTRKPGIDSVDAHFRRLQVMIEQDIDKQEFLWRERQKKENA